MDIADTASISPHRIARIAEAISVMSRIKAYADQLSVGKGAKASLVLRRGQMTTRLQMKNRAQPEALKLAGNFLHGIRRFLPSSLVRGPLARQRHSVRHYYEWALQGGEQPRNVHESREISSQPVCLEPPHRNE